MRGRLESLLQFVVLADRDHVHRRGRGFSYSSAFRSYVCIDLLYTSTWGAYEYEPQFLCLATQVIELRRLIEIQ